MTQASRFIYAVSFILLAVGFVMSFWPLSIAGVLLAAFSGRIIFAVFVAFLLDVAWGAPTGLAHFLYFPVTIVAVLAMLIRVISSRFLLSRDIPERI